MPREAAAIYGFVTFDDTARVRLRGRYLLLSAIDICHVLAVQARGDDRGTKWIFPFKDWSFGETSAHTVKRNRLGLSSGISHHRSQSVCPHSRRETRQVLTSSASSVEEESSSATLVTEYTRPSLQPSRQENRRNRRRDIPRPISLESPDFYPHNP